MCIYNLNGICFDPEKKCKGLVAVKCNPCPKQNLTELPDFQAEYVNPIFKE